LKSGGLHVPEQVTYQKEDGDATIKVFKGDDETLIDEAGRGFSAPQELGIDETDPRLLERSVAASRFDKHLGFGVTVKTDFARHQDNLGIVMDLAPGKSGFAGNRLLSDVHGVDRGDVQQQLIKIQLLDTLLAQADPNLGSFVVDSKDGKTKITSIDRDYCLGPKPSDPSKLFGYIKTSAYHCPVAYPPVIDTDMLEKIRDLKEGDIQDIMGGMFSDEEIAATKSRLTHLKNYCNGLEQNNRVIDPTEWGTAKAEELLIDMEQLESQNQNARDALMKKEKELAEKVPELKNNLNNWLKQCGKGCKKLYYNYLNRDDENAMDKLFDHRLPTKGVSRDEVDQIRRASEKWLNAKNDLARTEARLDEYLRLEEEFSLQKAKLKALKSQPRTDDNKNQIENQTFQLLKEIFKTTAKMQNVGGLLHSSYWQRDVFYSVW
ncbi:MAG: hypothetical protein MI861_08845, partial [Pirellulales bacterium]|nr:hypothetical protein [Pirellulales bacterium]